LPAFLYVYEAWSLTLKEEHKLREPRHRCEDDIKMDLKEVGWGGTERIIWLSIGTGGGCL